MPQFNKQLWEVGRKIEDDALPKLNKYFDCDFKRNDEDIWDIDDGWRVYFLFVFTDCSKIMELKADSEFKCKFTGSNCVRHYLIPVTGLTDFDPDADRETGEVNPNLVYDEPFISVEPESESEEENMIEIN